MNFITIVVGLGVAASVAAALVVRLAPSSPSQWHVDPTGAVPGMGAFVVLPEAGDLASPVLAMEPVAALEAFDAIALGEPRTERLAGHPTEGRVTYVSRSLVWGFPDYTTVQALPADGGTALAIYARLRFGSSDLGVNQARVTRWLSELPSS